MPTDPPAEPTDLHSRAQDDIALLALGEQVDAGVAAHVDSCPLCQQELHAYRHVAELARQSGRADDRPAPPPPEVWDRIVASLAGPVPTPEPAAEPLRLVPAPPGPKPALWKRAVLAAAAVLVLAGAGAAGWAIGHTGSTSSPSQAAEAVLAAQPGTENSAHGRAVIHASRDGYTLNVTSNGLPASDGYYEVWLFNPSVNKMVAVGTLGTGGRGSFTVPSGIDLRAYHVVDVSAQKYNGNNAHQRSVLQGPLTG